MLCKYLYLVHTHIHHWLQGLIFVVDSNDRERINEARDELYKMVSLLYLCSLVVSKHVVTCAHTVFARIEAGFE